MTTTVTTDAVTTQAFPLVLAGSPPPSGSHTPAGKAPIRHIALEPIPGAWSPPASEISPTPPLSPPMGSTSPLRQAKLPPPIPVAPQWWLAKQRKKRARSRRQIESTRALEAMIGKIGSQSVKAELLLSFPKDAISKIVRYKMSSVKLREDENRVLRAQIDERRQQIEIMETLLEANERSVVTAQKELDDVLAFAQSMSVSDGNDEDDEGEVESASSAASTHED